MNLSVVLVKKESIERCIAQIRLYRSLPVGPPIPDHLVDDAIESNLQKMAEQTIDIANHVIRKLKPGFPKDSHDSFEILCRAGVIDAETTRKMKGMVGFRNILVHEYAVIDREIFNDVVAHRLDDVVDFSNQVLKHLESQP